MRWLLIMLASSMAAPVCAEALVGLKLGTMSVDLPSSDNPQNLGVNLGYRLDTYLADLSLVAEVNRSLIDGETRRGDDLEFESEAVYLFGRTTRSLFASFRVGYVRHKIITGDDKRRDDGLLLGGGIGIAVGKTLMHLEYTFIARDAEFLSIGLEF